jgi:hypothetical protein
MTATTFPARRTTAPSTDRRLTARVAVTLAAGLAALAMSLAFSAEPDPTPAHDTPPTTIAPPAPPTTPAPPPAR